MAAREGSDLGQGPAGPPLRLKQAGVTWPRAPPPAPPSPHTHLQRVTPPPAPASRPEKETERAESRDQRAERAEERGGARRARAWVRGEPPADCQWVSCAVIQAKSGGIVYWLVIKEIIRAATCFLFVSACVGMALVVKQNFRWKISAPRSWWSWSATAKGSLATHGGTFHPRP
jgi:hypothetical protein